MKFLIMLFLLFSMTNVYAFNEYDEQEVCANPKTVSANLLICSKNAAQIMAAENKITSISILPFQAHDHLELGYPDDSTNVIYNYFKSIKDSTGNIIGYLNIFAIENSEASFRIQLKIYYSLKGEVVGGIAKDF